jgi:hypothetical protein
VINGTVVKNATSQVQQVLQNEKDWIDDPPANDAVREFRQTAKERYRDEVTNSTYYFFLNHREKPFDNEDARKAVNFAVDSGRSRACRAGSRPRPATSCRPACRASRSWSPAPTATPTRRLTQQGQADDPGSRSRRPRSHGVGQRRGVDQGPGPNTSPTC